MLGSRRRNRTIGVLFTVYLALLAWVVLFKLDVPWVGDHRLLKLVPFLPVGAEGPSEPVELAINLLLFVPFGVFLRMLRPTWPWWRALLVIAAASVALEAAQYVLGVGSSDTSDIIVNTAGGFGGFGLVALAERRWGARALPLLTRACAVGMMLALVATALWVAAPLHYGRPPDPGPLHAPGQSLHSSPGR